MMWYVLCDDDVVVWCVLGVVVQVYANGSAVPFMIPPFAAAAAAAAAGGSSLYPVMRPVKVESDWWVLWCNFSIA